MEKKVRMKVQESFEERDDNLVSASGTLDVPYETESKGSTPNNGKLRPQ